MSLQNFVDGVGPVVKANWLNQVDNFVNTLFGGATSVQTVRDVLALNQFGWRNRVRNGRMLINQRALASTTANGTYVVDGWALQNNGTNRVTGSQIAVSGILPAENMLRMQVTGTSGSPSAAEAYGHYQPIEGYSIADLGWGTAGAVGIVVSIRVRSSVVGTYALSFRNSATNRSYVANLTINNPNTVEDKVIYVPGDTTGTWLTNNGVGLYVEVGAAVGSTYQTTAGSWQAGNFIGITGQTQLTATANATFDFTLVQLEPARVATQPPTPFEWLPFDEELRRAQRYLPGVFSLGAFDLITSYGSTTAANTGIAAVMFKVPTRAPVTGVSLAVGTAVSDFNASDDISFAGVINSLTFVQGGVNSVKFSYTISTSPWTVGRPNNLFFLSAGKGFVITGAEL
jgi:hypothetical protein